MTEGSLVPLEEVPVVTHSSCYARSLSYRGIHEEHVGCPNSLSCLPDLDSEPPVDALETSVICSIWSLEHEGLSVKGEGSTVGSILAALLGKYPFFKSSGNERRLEVSPVMIHGR